MGAPKDIVRLQREDLNVSGIIESVTSPNCGAVSNFIGITRDNFENQKVKIFKDLIINSNQLSMYIWFLGFKIRIRSI